MKQHSALMALVPNEIQQPDGTVITPDESARPWARLPEETMHQYRLFKFYLRSGDNEKRSLQRLAKQLRMVYNTIATLSSRHNWQERAQAYDLYWLEREDVIRARQQDAAERRWAERRIEQREREWGIAEKLVARAQQMLDWPMMIEVIEHQVEELTEEGIVIKNIITQKPAAWSMRDLATFFELASKFARLAAGMDTDRKRLKVDLGTLTDEELARIAQGEA